MLKTFLCDTKTLQNFTSKFHKRNFDKFILKLKHTSPIVPNKPYQYNRNESQKHRTYPDNLNFFITLCARNINMRRSNYIKNEQFMYEEYWKVIYR